MLNFWPFKRGEKMETRASASGFTAEVMAARESYFSGRRGLAELTGTAQSCVSLWENAFALADVDGTDMLGRSVMAMVGRSLALRGEALFLIRDDDLIPCSDWDLRTRNGKPAAYRLSISEAGGGVTQTALAGEVLHVRIGADPAAPWLGTAPLRRASLTAGMLHALEASLAEAFENMPLGSQIVPMPEQADTDNNILGRSFRGQRGRVLLRESVVVTAAGGPGPAVDWRPSDVTPDISKAMTKETWTGARDSIAMAYGVLPCLFDGASQQGPAIREGQRHLAQWTLQPISELIAEEASLKLGATVTIDVMRPSQAFDAGGRARALSTFIDAMARAKEAGLAPGDVGAALRLVDWETQ
jgi:portal protein